MQERSRSILKNYFVTGHIPTQTEFYELLDSYLNTVDDPIGVAQSGGIGIGSETLPAALSVKGLLTRQLTGTVSIDDQNAPRQVNGSGTQFTSELQIGDPIRIENTLFTVVSIPSDTSLTLNTDASSVTAAPIYGRGPLLQLQSQDGQDRFFISDQGLVGIGNSAPTAELDVAGKVLAQQMELSGHLKAQSLEGDGSAITQINAAQLSGTLDVNALPDIPGIKVKGPLFPQADFLAPLTGTLSSSGVQVTGTGTQFTQQLLPGMQIKADGQVLQIDLIADDTHLSLVQAPSPDLVNANVFYPSFAFGIRDIDGNTLLLADGQGSISIGESGHETDLQVNGKIQANTLDVNGRIQAANLSVQEVNSPLRVLQSYDQPLQGTVSLTNGSTTLTGNQTQFTQALQAGSVLMVEGQLLQVASVESNTSLTLSQAAAGDITGANATTASQLFTVSTDQNQQHFLIDAAGNAHFTPNQGNGEVRVAGKFTASELHGDGANLTQLNPDNFSKLVPASQLEQIPADQIVGPLSSQAEYNIPLTGTLSATGTDLTGTSTLFTTELAAGLSIQVEGQILQIASITDDTNAVLLNPVSPDITNASAHKAGMAFIVKDTNGQDLFKVEDQNRLQLGLDAGESQVEVKGKLTAKEIESTDLLSTAKLSPGEIQGTLKVKQVADTPITGTVSTTANSNTLTGTGTLFTVELAPMVTVVIEGQQNMVQSIESDTSLTLRSMVTAAHTNVPLLSVGDLASFKNWMDTEYFNMDHLGNVTLHPNGGNGQVHVTGKLLANDFDGDGSNLHSLQAANLVGNFPATVIPDLDAAKITTGVLDPDRIPDIDGGKLSGALISQAGYTQAISGTISATATDLTGTGTLFTTELQAGDKIQSEGQILEIASITDDTNAVLSTAVSPDITNGQAYLPGDAFSVEDIDQNQLLLLDNSGKVQIGSNTTAADVQIEGDLEVSQHLKAAQTTPGEIQGTLKVKQVADTPITGTVSTTSSSRTLTGTGTQFTHELSVMVTVEIEGQQNMVQSIESDTSLTLRAPAAADHSNVPLLSVGPIASFKNWRDTEYFSMDFEGNATFSPKDGYGQIYVNGKLIAADFTGDGTNLHSLQADKIQGVLDPSNLPELPGSKIQGPRQISTGTLTNLSGTLSLTQGSKDVTGTATQFTTEVKEGDFLILDSQTYLVASISSDTALSIQADATQNEQDVNARVGTPQILSRDGNGDVSLSLSPEGKLGIGKDVAFHDLDVNGTVAAQEFIGSGAGLTDIPAANLNGPIETDLISKGTLDQPITGTVSITANNPIVSGTGTQFRDDLDWDMAIRIDDEVFRVSNVVNDTNITIHPQPTKTLSNVPLYIGSDIFQAKDGAGKVQFRVKGDGKVEVGGNSHSAELLVNGRLIATDLKGSGAQITEIPMGNILGELPPDRVGNGHLRIRSGFDNPLPGSVNITQGSKEVTGNNTQFTTDLQVGQYISINGESKYINAIADDTHLTVLNPFYQTQQYLGYYTRGDVLTAYDSSGQKALFLNGAGQIGVHTDAPTAPLEVNGLIKATEFEGDGSKVTGIDPSNITGTLAENQLPSELLAKVNQLENMVTNALQAQGTYTLHYANVVHTNWYNHYSFNFPAGGAGSLVLLSWYFEYNYGTPYNLFFKVNDQNTWTDATAPRYGTRFFTVDNPSKVQFGCTGGTNPIGAASFSVLST